MCLLIVKPPKQSIPVDYLYNAAIAHPHGAGYAFADGATVHIDKNHKADVDELIEALDDLHDDSAIVHFRYATHGSISHDNTHPFQLPNGYAAAHNGIFRNVSPIDDESDTRAFLRLHVAEHIRQGNLQSQLPTIEKLAVGNRLAILSPNGQATIIGERLGQWRDGIWYSNDSAFDDRPDSWGDDSADAYDVGYCVSCCADAPLDFICEECRDYYYHRYGLSDESILKLAEDDELPLVRRRVNWR